MKRTVYIEIGLSQEAVKKLARQFPGVEIRPIESQGQNDLVTVLAANGDETTIRQITLELEQKQGMSVIDVVDSDGRSWFGTDSAFLV